MTPARAVTAATTAALLLLARGAAAQVHEGKTIVEAKLVADSSRVQPGRAFTAGVHFTVEPGWHVYWINPGDTALPIRVAWNTPEGAKASPLRWPAPRNFREGGTITVFGYDRETLLLSTITPPKSLGGDTFTFDAKAEWLVCEKVCLPGEASLTLTLPVGDPAPSDNAEAVRRFAAQVPGDGKEAGISITSARAEKLNAERWRVSLAIDGAHGRIEAFFPHKIDGFAIEHGTIAVKGNDVAFTALPDDEKVVPRRVSGVVMTAAGSFDVAAAVSSGSAAPITPEVPATPPPAEPAVVPAPPPPVAATGGHAWLDQEFKTEAPSSDISLATLLAFAFLGGLILNVMPCVLPVISLKILGFVHQAGHEVRRTRMLGLLFAAGVIVSFWILVALVVALRAGGEQIGWGFQFQSPFFVVFMSVVVLIFAMNLFGTLEISGPALSGGAAAGQGPMGAFVHGMLATVLATPCTAPFLGTAIGFAFTQSLPILFLAFTAAAVGLAVPYVLLSWQPAWLRWLPRPGAWMIRFKQAMGFVLLGTLVWLLSVLGAQLGPEGIVWTLVFLTVVAFATWMVGQVPHGASRMRRVAVTTAAVLLAAAGYVWALETELRWRDPVPEAGGSMQTSEGIQWQPFSLDDLRQRVERGETVFIDFTADWCWSCKINERAVLQTTKVEKRMRELNVTAMKADWTHRNPEITRLLGKFRRVGVPYYAVFPAGKLTEPIGLSEVITPATVIEAIERAGPSLVKSKP